MLCKCWTPCILAAMVAVCFIGCGTPPAKDSSNKMVPGDSANKAAADDLPGLKELDPADRKLAEQQKVCPVSGERLGTAEMGKPYKMKLNGREFFLCCDGCEGAVKKDPDKYLKKVDELLAKK